MFTSEQIKEIATKLQAAGKRDSQFPVVGELKGNELFPVIRESQNLTISVDSFIDYANDALLKGFYETLDKYLKMINTSINDGLENIRNTVDTDVKDLTSTVHTDINTLTDTTKNTIQSVVDDVHSQITDFEDTLNSVTEGISNDWRTVNTQLAEAADSLDTSSESISSSAQQIAQSKTDIDSAVQDINDAKAALEEVAGQLSGNATLTVDVLPDIVQSSLSLNGKSQKSITVPKGSSVSIEALAIGYYPFYGVVTLFKDTEFSVVLIKDNSWNSHLALSPSSLFIQASEGVYYINPLYTNSWNAEITDGTWCTLGRASGNGNSFIVLNVTEHTGSATRSTTVKVTSQVPGEDTPDTATAQIIQNGVAINTTFDPDGYTWDAAPSSGGTYTIQGTSNAPILRISDRELTSFLTFKLLIDSSPVSDWDYTAGNIPGVPGNDAEFAWEIQVSYSQNTSVISRTGKFKVTDNNGHTSGLFTLTQEAAS